MRSVEELPNQPNTCFDFGRVTEDEEHESPKFASIPPTESVNED